MPRLCRRNCKVLLTSLIIVAVLHFTTVGSDRRSIEERYPPRHDYVKVGLQVKVLFVTIKNSYAVLVSSLYLNRLIILLSITDFLFTFQASKQGLTIIR